VAGAYNLPPLTEVVDVVRLQLLLVALLCGCPAPREPATPAPGSASVTDPPSAPAAPATPPSQPASSASPEPEMVTRAELMGLDPVRLFANGLRGDGPRGLAEGLTGLGAMALAEQVRAEGSPREALALASVIFQRAAESTRPGEPAAPPVRDKLDRDIDVQAGDQPRFEAWLLALRDACARGEDYAAAATFLGQAHLTWGSVDAARDLERD